MADAGIPQDAAGKKTWPELMGKSYEEAQTAIKGERPDVDVSKVTPGQPMTRDYRDDRVRIMVDENNMVVIQAPSVG